MPRETVRKALISFEPEPQKAAKRVEEALFSLLEPGRKEILDPFRTVSQLDFGHLRPRGVGYARHRNLPKEVIEVPTLPKEMIRVLAPFAPLFSKSVWPHVQILLVGAILAPGKRTVASALRVVGLQEEKRFCRYHRVLSRAVWSSKEASRVLLSSLVETFVPEGALVVGVDETLERRQGKRIVARRASTAIRCAPLTPTS